LHGQTNALSERIVYDIYRVTYFQPRHPLTSQSIDFQPMVVI
jgi:hypothetical protein